jgi:hypothetical protein
MWTLPSRCELNPNQWETLRSNACFQLQQNRSVSTTDQSLLWKSVVDTLQNVFDTKQLPFRIVLASPSDTHGHLVSIAPARAHLDKEWPVADKWAAECAGMDASDREAFCLAKIQSQVAAQTPSTAVVQQEAMQDEKFRAALRSFRSLFPAVPDGERLVCFYACAYQKFQNQGDFTVCVGVDWEGWLYVSENYLGFYAYVLGVETRVFIELKDILELKKVADFFKTSVLISGTDKEGIAE